MQKKCFWVMAILALIGFANCVFVEPALACKEDASACAIPSTHGCLVCNSSGHQWVAPKAYQPFNAQCLAHSINTPSAESPVDPPLGSIFHPPTVF